MNTLQKQLLNLWKDVDKVIKKSDFKLIPWAGTLLGAVRHNGFIPWDDDMDFGFIGKNFKELADYLRNNLPKKYIVSAMPDKGIRHGWIKIYDSSHYSNIDEGTKKNYKHPFIDIFNLLRIDSSDGNTFGNRFWGEVNWAKNVKMFSSPQVIPIRPLLALTPQSFIYKKIQKTMERINNEDGKYVYEFASFYYKTFPSKLFAKYKEIKFENIVMDIPSNFDEILKIHYGDWHQIPKEEDRRYHVLKIV